MTDGIMGRVINDPRVDISPDISLVNTVSSVKTWGTTNSVS